MNSWFCWLGNMVAVYGRIYDPLKKQYGLKPCLGQNLIVPGEFPSAFFLQINKMLLSGYFFSFT